MSILSRFSQTPLDRTDSDRDDGFVTSSCGGGSGREEQDKGPGPVSVRPPCLRCNQKTGALAVTRLRVSDALCAGCTESTVGSRLKRVMTNDPARGQDVLIAASSGAASLSAVNIASQIMNCGRKRRFWKDASVVHVDCAIIGDIVLATQAKNIGATSPLELEAGLLQEKIYSPLQTVLNTSIASGIHAYVIPLEAALIHDKLFVLPVQAPEIALPSPSEVFGSFSNSVVATEVVETITKNAIETLHECRQGQLEVDNKEGEVEKLNSSCEISGDVTSLREAGKLLKTALSSTCASSDDLQEAVSILINKLIVRCAAALNFHVLQTCETADRMGLRVMLSACSGNGFSLPADAGVEDSRFREFGECLGPFSRNVILLTKNSPQRSKSIFGNDADDDVRSVRLQSNWYSAMLQESRVPVSFTSHLPIVFRPLVEVEQREIMYFARFRNLSSKYQGVVLSFTVGSPLRTSVSHTVMSVLSGLQAAFPSTVHNVVRTARKLIVPEAIHDRDERTVSSLSAKNKGSNSLDMCALGLCSFCFSLLPLLDKDLFQVETSTVTTNEKKDSIVRSLCYRCKRLKRVLPTLIGK
jgi:hypothetical protein